MRKSLIVHESFQSFAENAEVFSGLERRKNTEFGPLCAAK
jgi:hypothetical protein